MSLTIQGNAGSSIAHRALEKAQGAMDRALAKLSSGQKAQSARDDAAGLAVSSRIRGEIVSLQKYVLNAQQGSAMLQVAEGSYQRAQDMLVRMRSLASQAQGGNLSATERGMLDTEYQQLKNEITRIAKGTSFGSTALFEVGNMSLDFANSTSYNLATAGSSTGSVQLADFNGDGFVDSLNFNSTSQTIGISYGRGDGTFAAEVTLFSGIAGMTFPLSIIGDFNGDGTTDFGVYNGSSVAFYNNDGSGNFTAGGTVAGAIQPMAAADMDGDGRTDFVTRSGTTVTIYRSVGDGTFTTTSMTANVTATNMLLGDMNNDGRMDIILNSTTQAQVLSSNGSGGYSNGTVYTNAGNNFNFQGSLADFDGDGFLDIVIAKTGGNVELIRNRGNGTLSLGANVSVGVSTALGRVGLSDMNGDGYLDIVTSSTVSTSVFWLQGTGGFSFASPQNTTIAGGFNLSINFADLNNDGRVDVLVRKQTTLHSILNNSTVGLQNSIRVGSSAANIDNILFRTGSIRLNSLDSGLEQSMINSIGSAKRAEESIKRALNMIGIFRTNVAASINRLEKVQDNLTNMIENQEGARSAIADLDVADEMSNFVAQKIVVEAGISMLAQANKRQKILTELLQG